MAQDSMEGDEFDPTYEAAMKRLDELKAKPVEQLTEDEKKEKLRLANRESARKMRRKQAEALLGAGKEVERLEAEHRELMHKLAEGFYKFKEIKQENEVLKGELQALQAFQGSADGGAGAGAFKSEQTGGQAAEGDALPQASAAQEPTREEAGSHDAQNNQPAAHAPESAHSHGEHKGTAPVKSEPGLAATDMDNDKGYTGAEAAAEAAA